MPKKGKSTPPQKEETEKGLPVPIGFIAVLAMVSLAIIFGPSLIAGMSESGAIGDTSNPSGSGIDGADTGTTIISGKESSEEIKIGTSKVIGGVLIESRIVPGKNEKMVDDFFISNIQITAKKITFTMENRDEDYLQTISTVRLVCNFMEHDGYAPYSYSFYPDHPTKNGEEIENTEINFFSGNRIDLEVNIGEGKNIKKVLFYIEPGEKIPIEIIKWK